MMMSQHDEHEQDLVGHCWHSEKATSHDVFDKGDIGTGGDRGDACSPGCFHLILPIGVQGNPAEAPM